MDTTKHVPMLSLRLYVTESATCALGLLVSVYMRHLLYPVSLNAPLHWQQLCGPLGCL